LVCRLRGIRSAALASLHERVVPQEVSKVRARACAAGRESYFLGRDSGGTMPATR
jgi:hypothetical protein